MAIYPVVHKESGETKEVEMSIHEWDTWKEENPNWTRDWSQGCASPAQEGEWKNKLINKHPGWKTVLDQVKKAPKSNVRDLY
jgi:hypothetical protein